MKIILLLAALTLNSVSFASTPAVKDNTDSSAIEAINAYCGSSTQMYWSKISSIRYALKTGKISNSELDKAIDSLTDLKADIKTNCN